MNLLTDHFWYLLTLYHFYLRSHSINSIASSRANTINIVRREEDEVSTREKTPNNFILKCKRA